MIPDLDAYRSPNVLVRRYGDGACRHAADRTDNMIAAGNLDGAAAWPRINAAVLELTKVEPNEGEAVQ